MISRLLFNFENEEVIVVAINSIFSVTICSSFGNCRVLLVTVDHGTKVLLLNSTAGVVSDRVVASDLEEVADVAAAEVVVLVLVRA